MEHLTLTPADRMHVLALLEARWFGCRALHPAQRVEVRPDPQRRHYHGEEVDARMLQTKGQLVPDHCSSLPPGKNPKRNSDSADDPGAVAPSFSFPEASIGACSPEPFTRWVSSAAKILHPRMPKGGAAPTSTTPHDSHSPPADSSVIESKRGSSQECPSQHSNGRESQSQHIQIQDGDSSSQQLVERDFSSTGSSPDSSAHTSLQALLRFSEPIRSLPASVRSAGHEGHPMILCVGIAQGRQQEQELQRSCSQLVTVTQPQTEAAEEWKQHSWWTIPAADGGQMEAKAKEGGSAARGRHLLEEANSPAEGECDVQVGQRSPLSVSMPQPGLPIQAPACLKYRRVQISCSGGGLANGSMDSCDASGTRTSPNRSGNTSSGQIVYMDSLERAFLSGFETPPPEQLLSRSGHERALFEDRPARGGNIMSLLQRNGSIDSDKGSEKNSDKGQAGGRRVWQQLPRSDSEILIGSIEHLQRLAYKQAQQLQHEQLSNSCSSSQAVNLWDSVGDKPSSGSAASGRSFVVRNQWGPGGRSYNNIQSQLWEDDITVLPRIETLAQWQAGFKVHKVKLGGAVPEAPMTSGR